MCIRDSGTPDGLLFEGEVQRIVCRSITGDLAILAGPVSYTHLVVLLWAVFGIGHLAVPEQIPFDYTVLLAGFIGGMVAVLNFFLMGLTVQKIVSMEDDKQAAAKMKASYSQRMMLQLIWGVLAIAVPCFQFVAGILPLLFPNIVIKTVGIIGGRKAA